MKKRNFVFLAFMVLFALAVASCSGGPGDNPPENKENLPGLVSLPEGGYVPETGAISLSSSRTEKVEGEQVDDCTRTYRLNKSLSVSSQIKNVASGNALLIAVGGSIGAVEESVEKCAATYATTGPATVSVDEYQNDVCPKGEMGTYNVGYSITFPQVAIPALKYDGAASADANQSTVLFGLNRDGTYLLYIQVPLLNGKFDQWDDNYQNSMNNYIDAISYMAIICKGTYKEAVKEISSSEPGTSCSYVAGGAPKETFTWTISFQSPLITPAPPLEPLAPPPAPAPLPHEPQPVS